METPLTRLLRNRLRDVLDGNESELARLVGTSQQNINNYLTGKVIKPHYWRAVNKALGISDKDVEGIRKQMKAERSEVIGYGQDALIQALMNPHPTTDRHLPVLGRAVGGADGKYIFNGEPIGHVGCPPSLEGVPGAYAVFVSGESMWPRFKPGETAWVHPHRPPRRGNDVVVQIRPEDDDGSPPWGYIKEFVGWQGNKLVLQQYNPEMRLEFDREDVVSVHPIVLSTKD